MRQYMHFNICFPFLLTYISMICGLLSNGNSYVEIQLLSLLYPELMKFLRIHEKLLSSLKQLLQACVSKAHSTRHFTLSLGSDRLD